MCSHTLKKCLAFFAFRLGSRHARKFDAAGILPYAPIENTVLPALLRVTKSAIGCGLKGSVSTPTLKTALPFFQPWCRL